VISPAALPRRRDAGADNCTGSAGNWPEIARICKARHNSRKDGDNNASRGLAEDFTGGIAEHLLGTRIEVDDRALIVDREDGVLGRYRSPARNWASASSARRIRSRNSSRERICW